MTKTKQPAAEAPSRLREKAPLEEAGLDQAAGGAGAGPSSEPKGIEIEPFQQWEILPFPSTEPGRYETHVYQPSADGDPFLAKIPAGGQNDHR